MSETPIVNFPRSGDRHQSPETTINNFLDKPGIRNILLGIFLSLSMVEGFFLYFAYREKQVSEDLHTFNAQAAQVQLEVDKQILAILNCKR